MKIDLANLDWKDAHDLLVSAVLPRPIAFVSTIGKDGVYNLAPFSYFAVLSTKPAVVGIGIERKRDGRKKDTQANIEFAKDFVINMVTESMARAMNQASGEYPSHVDEFKETGLTPAQSDLIRSPRVTESPVNMECKLMQILEFGEPPRISSFIIGEIMRVHIKDEVWVDGVIKAHQLKVIGRLGEDFYCRTMDIFEMKRPNILPKP
ncbi:MAG: flavin reductase family protein [Thermodesulfobacteriota bacterium]|jgi:flavin reductase (DIM6/NTAB) family NADH-FMN oxidoreductase RutF